VQYENSTSTTRLRGTYLSSGMDNTNLVCAEVGKDEREGKGMNSVSN